MFTCFYIHLSIYETNKIDQNTPITVSCHFMQIQKVMPVGCDWCISICLVCFICWMMYVETYKHWKWLQRCIAFVEGDDSDKVYLVKGKQKLVFPALLKQINRFNFQIIKCTLGRYASLGLTVSSFLLQILNGTIVTLPS